MPDLLVAFLKAAQSDDDLLTKLKSANNPSEIAAIANDAGYSLNSDDFSRADSVITEHELESIAGGVCWSDTSSSDCGFGELNGPGPFG